MRDHNPPACARALTCCALALAAAAPASAATPPDQQSAKPMVKNEPMAGEMKNDGMMKEDVSKAEKAWSKRMDEKMKQEKMK